MERARLFSAVPSARTRGDGHTLKYWRFPLNIRKYFFIVRVTQQWHRLSKQPVDSPSLKIFKTHVDMVLGISST